MEQELYPFTQPEQKQLFLKVSKEIKCKVCQNQSLFDSKAPTAVKLREEIYQQILKGKSESEIIDWVVLIAGKDIVYRPDFNSGTFCLWIGPVILFVAACFLFRKLCR